MQSEKDFTEKLLTLDEAIEALADFGKFKHLFSEDVAEKQLAKLLQTLRKIRLDYRLSELKAVKFPEEKPLSPYTGDYPLVSIRPVAEEYGGKTYIGFHLGDMAVSTTVSIQDDAIQCGFGMRNPAIYVPELKKVIYGYESWWGEIESPEQFREITGEDISNVWYVKMLKDIVAAESDPTT